MRSIVLIIAAAVLGGLGRGYIASGGDVERGIVCDTVTVMDTIRYYIPMPRDSVVVRYETYRVERVTEICDSTVEVDSVAVELPIVQKHYADSTYEAWVSGPLAPKLDSLRVFAPVRTVTVQSMRAPRRWHVGVGAGCAVTPAGVQPYIGIGVSYSIFAF